jgi:hypothetical protein
VRIKVALPLSTINRVDSTVGIATEDSGKLFRYRHAALRTLRCGLFLLGMVRCNYCKALGPPLGTKGCPIYHRPYYLSCLEWASQHNIEPNSDYYVTRTPSELTRQTSLLFACRANHDHLHFNALLRYCVVVGSTTFLPSAPSFHEIISSNTSERSHRAE